MKFSNVQNMFEHTKHARTFVKQKHLGSKHYKLDPHNSYLFSSVSQKKKMTVYVCHKSGPWQLIYTYARHANVQMFANLSKSLRILSWTFSANFI